MKKILSSLLCVILAISPFIQTYSESSFSNNPDSIEEAIKSVLFIGIFDKNDELIATGSGFIAFTNRTIVTNYHVIEGAENVYAVDEKDNFFVIDRIIAVDEEKDIAILSFKSTINLTPLRLNENPNLKRGQPVVAIGSPEGLKNSVSTGIISSLYDRDDVPEIQFTASISHGSSGGALFNDAGEVIGVTSGMYEEGQNLNFAIGIYHVIDLYRKYFPNYIQEQPAATSTAVATNPPIATRTPTATPTKNSLPAPSIKTIQANGDGVYLNWSAVVGSVEYQILRSSTANGDYQVLDTIPGNYFFDDSVAAGSRYYYKIAVTDTKTRTIAISDAEEILVQEETPSPTSKPTQKPSSIATPRIFPPKNIEATVTDKSIHLTWSAVEGVTRYRVFRSTSVNGTYLYHHVTSSLSYEDKNVEQGKTYFYKVASEYKPQGISEKSDYVMATVPILTPMPTPTPIGRITPEEIDKYKTLKVGMNDPDVARLKERLYELGYFSSKTVNSTYSEKTAEYVKEFQRANGLKVDGIASPEMQALFFSEYAIPKPTPSPKPSPTPKPTPRLSKPTKVKATISGTTVTVTWTANKNAVEYRVYRSTNATGYYSQVATVTNNKYIDTKTVRGYTYYYKIESANGKNVSDKSAYTKAVMPKPTPTPYVEPKYPLEDIGTGYSGTSYGIRWFKNIYKNTSERSTIDGYTIAYYAEDVYGNRLKAYGYGDEVLYETINQTIRPGRQGTTPKITAYGFDSAKKIYVAVVKMHFTDGRTISVPDNAQHYWYWEY